MVYSSPHYVSLQKIISSMNKKRKIPPWPKVKELALVSVPPNPAYHAAFIDGILWSCQPMQIRVELSPDDEYSMKVTFLIRLLVIIYVCNL